MKTRFKGDVKTLDGVPVTDIEVFLDIPKYVTVSEGKTDDNGRFDLTICLPADDMEHHEEIAAVVKGPWRKATTLPPVTVRDEKGNPIGMFSGASFSHGFPRNLEYGSSPVQFKVGDTISNIHIIMQRADDSPALVGTITTEDEKWPVSFQIQVTQENHGLNGQVELDHSFRVDWIRPGPFLLNIYGSPTPNTPYDRFGFRQNQLYCSQTLELEMPADQQILHVDVIVPKAGELAGCVINQERQPVVDAKILVHGTEYPDGKTITDIIPFYTDENGLFWVYGQRVGKDHIIEVIPPGASEPDPTARLEGIKPPDRNITIMLKN